jgi:hypothetical protein
MSSGTGTGWDGKVTLAPVIALTMIGCYLWVIPRRSDHMDVWLVVGLAAAVLVSIYGGLRRAPRRELALVVASAAWMVFGFVNLWTIGPPLLVAGVVALAAAVRIRRAEAHSAR